MQCGLALAATLTLALAPLRLRAEEPAAAPAQPATAVITDLADVWLLSSEQKAVAHPIRLEGRVSYYDAGYKLFWLETRGVGNYVVLGSSAPAMRAGQHVVIEGTIVPVEGLSASRVTVKVIQEFEPIVPLETKGRIGDIAAFSTRVVAADGYVDSQLYVDAEHTRLILIIDGRPVICWVKPDDPNLIPRWAGSFVRVTGLYSGRFDPTGTQITVELWVSRQSDLSVLGSIESFPAFDRPQTAINQLFQVPDGTEVHIHGRVEAHEPGSYLAVRDDTGQVVVRSVQKQRLRIGSEVEVVGRVAISGSRWVIEEGLYRSAHPSSPAGAAPPRSTGALATVEQIRQLSAEEAARGRPVTISGMVTWALAEADFFFLQDLSGGVRVHLDRSKLPEPQWLKYLRIEGVTYNGAFAPAVELRSYVDLGSMAHPPPKPITFDQAITGREDGQWVEMRGFIRRTESDKDWRWIYVTTPTGEFVGLLQSPVNFVANPGSLIRVQGVCEARADSQGRITGVILRVPFIHDISTDEDAPADIYDQPLRAIKDLRQLNTGQDLTRVRVAGTVLHAVPGNAVYVQEADAAVMVLSRDNTPLAPGDRIEAVGILGSEGVHTVLREAVYRKTASGGPPTPLVLADPAHFLPSLDARLVQVRATLIDALPLPGRLRLTLQSGAALFEAVLDEAPSTLPAGLLPGAGLELTGVYKVSFDDTRQTRGFELQLRSARDIAVFQKARFLTVGRALLIAAILGGCSLLGLGWITALRRRVRQQTGQIREQMERQAHLEAEVQHAARLESLGVLAGGIAHDFNNLLTIMMGNLGLAMLDDKVVNAAGPLLREIEHSALRARDLTLQLLTFAKGGDPLRATVALPEVIQGAAQAVRHGPAIRFDYEFPPELWNAHADKSQIAQAVQSILVNAVQAMPNGGVIRVSLRNEEIAAGPDATLPAGRYVRLAIADTGEGIRPDILPRIFDPYFTTKEKANGLGLATVYSIIKRHEGRIKVESTPGQGATFSLWLPAATVGAPLPSASPRGPSTATMSPLQPARVLLMDDEESIRRLGSALLRRIGLETVEVRDGGEAVRAFTEAREAGRPFDLLILDLTVPAGMGGKETIEIIRKLDPRVPAIVSSGYANTSVLSDFSTYGFQACVPKPYEIGELAKTVKRLLPVA